MTEACGATVLHRTGDREYVLTCNLVKDHPRFHSCWMGEWDITWVGVQHTMGGEIRPDHKGMMDWKIMLVAKKRNTTYQQVCEMSLGEFERALREAHDEDA